MSILHSFDSESEAIINPAEAVQPVQDFPETVLSVFSEKFVHLLASSYRLEQVSYMTGGRTIPIFCFEYKGERLGFYHSLLGGSASGALLEEIIAKGGKQILFFGSCGSLDKTISSGNLIVPTHAYRDEGTSYHYLPPGDYLTIPTSARLAEIFSSMGVPFRQTRVWTTDSFYRETRKNREMRKREGCSAVDMECASVMAVGLFRKIPVYQFLYIADCLDGSRWDPRILGKWPAELRQAVLRIALETAIRL